MQGKHGNPSLRYVLTTFLLMLMTLLLFLGAPGKVSAATATIVTHQVVGSTLPVGQKQTLSVSCASGEQLLSGGFYGYAFEQAAYIVSSYPSTANTWTVTIDNTIAPSTAVLTAYVYCLQASYSLGTTIVQATNSSSSGLVTANCPTSSMLIAGGYAGTKRIVTTSSPGGNGWQTDAGTAYAICATQNVTSTSLTSATFTTPTNSTSSGATATCASGLLASGGGFSGPNSGSMPPIYISEEGNTGWGVAAGGSGSQSTITVWAVCASFPDSAPTTPTVVPVTPTSTPTSPVQITYQVVSQWTGGFTAIIKICNITPNPLYGWTLQFTFPGDQQITNGWGATINQAGAVVTLTALSYNRVIAPGQCIIVGFNGTWKTSNASPTSFLFNGTPTH